MKPSHTMDFRRRWVLITGASSGLGREMAQILARYHSANLVLAARREDRLQQLKHELEADTGVKVLTIPTDLTQVNQVENLFQLATQACNIYAVILNAGVTHFGEYHHTSWETLQTILTTNITSTMRLSHLFIPYLLQRGQGGGILLIASMAGLIPVPYQAAYSGSKGFLINFGRCLCYELANQNISITTVVPGGITTELLEKNQLSHHFKPSSPWMMSSHRCAHEAIKAFRQRRCFYIPGLVNRASLLLADILPRRVSSALIGAEYRKALLALQKDDR